ncbi:similar to Saccharomyces cerevisiae YFL047W RGD2 GTPase-activating protein (RhoGAP) for Cdc42p and Rho5p [Maudiozyma barnettii]|uniref:Similar to Saccharomyces cerevisiae YFL047W RGD2 GTPase-activating protein (RhoGAP) for Cdc42p and Rho5p n=1 Tax=Maudiozyma barnettii TaxID=61262 RepID=A0A8H2ZFL8_9SACH|nr:GTPase-activating protein RGD2 [Kazachstania barnettii]CAB4252490.1 similar to Saccharomyces cerevisiae YFL047W RGD2 GTPase-activating protein (RhoGAP) for Cdc42p and Rho5p [Kazachstania barnettii]CAD1779224.1 similar to Saccharomyces cerevisiae YFL047W RGD2 GTPase-activating protein (RhoGAP) for Cdc42p and Rho5p [Kazachstania barnettii]
MPSFADSFWSDDMTSGLQVLFYKLYNGCNQCDAFIQLFASRMQYEVAYGRQLCGVQTGIDKEPEDHLETTAGIALHHILKEMQNEGDEHLNIASNIESLVLQPFSQWCLDHKGRIKYSEKTLMDNVKNLTKSKSYVSKLEREYFNKCKKLEDFKRINFMNDDELTKAMKSLDLQKQHELYLENEKENQLFGKLGDIEFDCRTLRETMTALLKDLPHAEYRLPLINYPLTNTNTGYEITHFILEIMSFKDTDQAERFGQDLLDFGFLKYVNGVGNTFVNSKKFQYQWKDYAYKFAKLPNTGSESDTNNNSQTPENLQENISRNFSNLTRYFSGDSISGNTTAVLSNNTTDSVDDSFDAKELSITSSVTESNNNSKKESTPVSDTTGGSKMKESKVGLEPPNITDIEKTLHGLIKDVEATNLLYFKECNKMDTLRCSVEELMIDHLSFIEKCELDRTKAIKKATIDFCSTISNKIAQMKVHIEKMIDAEGLIDPTGDLLGLISKYNTGLFQPKVITYNNYYNPGIYQNFGIDLETRCRLDKRVVPLIVTVILSYMDMMYPDMENDKIRVSIWTQPVKLSLTHQLRNLLNKTQFKSDEDIMKILKEGNYEPSTIASVLKIYLLELPEPLITTELAEILGVLYNEYPQSNDDKEENNEEKRITGIFTALASLPKPHIATLDAISTHFYRLIKILRMANADNTSEEKSKEVDMLVSTFITDVSKEFANCILHAKKFEDNELGYKIFYDLLTHKKRIFKELKRQNSSVR